MLWTVLFMCRSSILVDQLSSLDIRSFLNRINILYRANKKLETIQLFFLNNNTVGKYNKKY